MNRAAVRILHVEPGPRAGPLETWLGAVRFANGGRLRDAFVDAGAADALLLAGSPDGVPFGSRARRLVADLMRAERPAARASEPAAAAGNRPVAGLVLLGSGALPLARSTDLVPFVDVASSGEHRALTNNRYSADIVSVGRMEVLSDVPDLTGDNALPRWLEEVAGIAVRDLRGRSRLAMDLDSPLDVVLIEERRGNAWQPSTVPPSIDLGPVRERIAAVARLAGDSGAELVVAGRTSARTLGWLERRSVARVRALVEERGLRASTPLARRPGRPVQAGRGDGAAGAPPRPPRSVLGLLLDERGPDALGGLLAELGDAAIVDSRVLLAHRLGPDEGRWPRSEDRYASDLLLPDGIDDPWLRALTLSARQAPLPVLLGGHSLVGPGISLLLGGRRR